MQQTKRDQEQDQCDTCSQLENKLFQSNQLLYLLMESNPFSIFWKDKDLVYQGCNQRFAEIAGFQHPAEVTGKTDFEMSWGIGNEIGAEACRDSDKRVIDSGREEMHIIELIKQEDGNIAWTDTSKVPIRDQAGNVIGVLGVLEDITKRKLTEQALETANKELERLSRIDSLTKVSNRRYFAEQLKTEWQRAIRQRTELSCIMFDIDHFKKINDLFGHLVGDECLLKVAETAKSVLKRPTDIIARYGGEEFIIILPTVGADGAENVAEAIRSNIEGISLPPPNAHVRVTASFGVAHCLPGDETSSEDLIAAADIALYRAKDAGRNCVVLDTNKPSCQV